MDVLNPMTYDAEEDQLRERTKYSQMDKLILPVEFQQQPVSTGVRGFEELVSMRELIGLF